MNNEGLCISCDLPALPRCRTDAGRREYGISGLCEVCFDNLFLDEDVVEPVLNIPPEQVLTLTELQYAPTGDGPWKIYLFNEDGYYDRENKYWFRRGKMKYPAEECTIEHAKKCADEWTERGLEVKITDGGDMLVFHSVNGEIVYGPNFWREVGL